MKRSLFAVALAASLTAACGSSDPLHSTSGPSPIVAGSSAASGGTFSTRDAVVLQCGDVTYVGPIRLPISVHGTTVNFSWLGNDYATRGYEVQFEIYSASNQWLPALTRVVTSPEIEQFLRTEATYRVRVRGLFCGDAIGPFTDWVVFSTDDTEDHHTPPPAIVPPPICPTSIGGCFPPPPPVVCEPNEHLVDGECVHNGDGDGNGNGQGDDHGGGNDNPPPPPPPVFEDTVFCHAEFHAGHPAHGHSPAEDPYYTYQTKTAHSQQELDQHIGIHDHDYLGACTN